MEDLGIDRYHYALTVICYYDGELTQKALAEKLGKDKSLIVNIIDVLTENGFVYREINPADRREHLIRVTDKAKKAVPQIMASFEKINRRIKENISLKDMEIFENVLCSMQNNLERFPVEKKINL
jgi:MarR family transcriptional regulator for hemolysin